MRVNNPRNLALLISALGVVLLVASVLIYALIEGSEIDFLSLLITGSVSFLSIYGVTYLLIQRYLQRKVSMIYRTMHDPRSTKLKNVQIHMGSDVLGEVGQETKEWLDKRTEEIKELEERELYRREFIGNLSHELKTPLFNIEGYILTLLEGGLEDENVNRDFLERAASGVERLTRIVEDMDMISKLESGVMDMKIERVDLMRIISEVVEETRINNTSSNITIEIKKPKDKPVMVLADRDRIAQVFTNLLNNSLKYGKEGGRVSIDVLDIEGQLWVEVNDDGIGISREHLPRLFERFYRVGKSRSRHEGGSGLGLAIVKHIMDAHGQTITVTSMEGKGTTFNFTLQRSK